MNEISKKYFLLLQEEIDSKQKKEEKEQQDPDTQLTQMIEFGKIRIDKGSGNSNIDDILLAIVKKIY